MASGYCPIAIRLDSDCHLGLAALFKTKGATLPTAMPAIQSWP